MQYTAGQAARAAGVSVSTITRALKNGRISGQKDDSGRWSIDASELHRVFPRKTESNVTQQADATALQVEISLLREALQREVEARQAWQEQAERLTRALPGPESKSERKGWLFWKR